MGEIVIVPIESGVADFSDAMFSFNETGAVAWKCIEQKTIGQICAAIAEEYDSGMDQIERGVKKLVTELLEKELILSGHPESHRRTVLCHNDGIFQQVRRIPVQNSVPGFQHVPVHSP